MARSRAQIRSIIVSQLKASPALSALILPEDGGSQASSYSDLIEVMVDQAMTYEQIHDAFRLEIQSLATRAMPSTEAWLQDWILRFQNGDQVLFDSDYAPYYATIDVTKQIVTRCAVVDGDPITIKVAKGQSGSLGPLSAGELSALQDFFFGTSTAQGIGAAGQFATFVNLDPDRLYIEADVYYQAQFGETVSKQAVVDAINNYFNTLNDESFNGTVVMETLRDKIQAVNGVTRIVLNTVRGRANAVAFGGGEVVDIQGVYQTVAGYLISEDTTNQTLNDKITMIKETA